MRDEHASDEDIERPKGNQNAASAGGSRNNFSGAKRRRNEEQSQNGYSGLEENGNDK